jgi:hypothetical protein
MTHAHRTRATHSWIAKLRRFVETCGLLAALSLAAGAAQAQDFVWGKRIVAGLDSASVRGLALNANRDVHATGFFHLTVDFDPGPGVFNMTATNGAVYVTKLSPIGRFVWARKMGGGGFDEGKAIAVDRYGNLYVAGHFEGTADFDPGPSTFNLTALGLSDIFVCKLDANGSFVWAKRIGGEDEESVEDLALDAAGNVYTVGAFRGTVDFDPGPGRRDLTTESEAAFVSRLNEAGEFISAWAVPLGLFNRAHAIAVDDEGNSYIAGEAGLESRVGGILTVGFIRAFGRYGNALWEFVLHNRQTIRSEGHDIALDAEKNVYIAGVFDGIVDFAPGPETAYRRAESRDIFILKLDSAGAFIWARALGGASAPTLEPYSLALDGRGNAYVAGTFRGAGDFNPGPGIHLLPGQPGGAATFAVKLSRTGRFAWAAQFGHADSDASAQVAVGRFGNVHIAGHFEGTIDLDPGAESFNLTPVGAADIFLTKWSQP